jgi:hypothetical protein
MSAVRVANLLLALVMACVLLFCGALLSWVRTPAAIGAATLCFGLAWWGLK